MKNVLSLCFVLCFASFAFSQAPPTPEQTATGIKATAIIENENQYNKVQVTGAEVALLSLNIALAEGERDQLEEFFQQPMISISQSLLEANTYLNKAKPHRTDAEQHHIDAVVHLGDCLNNFDNSQWHLCILNGNKALADWAKANVDWASHAQDMWSAGIYAYTAQYEIDDFMYWIGE